MMMYLLRAFLVLAKINKIIQLKELFILKVICLINTAPQSYGVYRKIVGRYLFFS